jgi:hypothetical protein
MTNWEPIETAPREYSPRLSFYNHHAPQILGLWGQAFYCVCSWGGPSQPYWIGDDNKKVPFQPTHWTPLPVPPAQGIEAGTAETVGLGPKDESPVASGDAP